MAAQAPAGATTGAATHRPLLIGAGIGCGCLSILGALLVVFLIFAAAPKSGPVPPAPTPLPGPGPQPPGPPGITPQPPGPPGPPIAPAPGPGPVPQPGPVPPPGPAPQPGPMPGPGPQPGPMPGPGPQPQPGPQQPGGTLNIQVVTARVDQNGTPVQPAQQFRVGETVASVVILRSIPTAVQLGHVWLRVQGDRVEPLAEPAVFQIDPSAQGKTATFRIKGLPPGDYMAGVFVPGPGGEMQPVTGAQFSVR